VNEVLPHWEFEPVDLFSFVMLTFLPKLRDLFSTTLPTYIHFSRFENGAHQGGNESRRGSSRMISSYAYGLTRVFQTPSASGGKELIPNAINNVTVSKDQRKMGPAKLVKAC
jgi:hypothetical protein